MPPLTAFIISHTHWDREWYQPFQEFRVRLVAMVDRLLDLLDADPAYRHFMLDGQTIVLDDYLAIQPDRRADLACHAAKGRLLVGPWYVLPDEFLVGPESLVRNLLLGREIALGFGAPMPVGYIPDTFGHISQLPQVFAGFGLETAAVWRGVPDLPTVFTWLAADGSSILAANLREGYGDLAWAPADAEGFTAAVRQAIARLRPYAPAGQVALLDGTDHVEARPDLPGLIAAANEVLAAEGIRLVHATLPQYLDAVRAAKSMLTEAVGEFRDSRRNNILPAVLSARMWIKQRNRATETLLGAWAEPFSALAGWMAPGGVGLEECATAGLLQESWRLLLQNQPHDSICGCSVDQVHDEMRSRFDQADQIGEELARRSLAAIAGQVDTRAGGSAIPVVVCNPTSSVATGTVTAEVQIPPSWPGFEVVDSRGRAVEHAVTRCTEVPFSMLGIEAMEVVTRVSAESAERIGGQGLLELAHSRTGSELRINALLGCHGLGDQTAIAMTAAEIRQILAADSSLRTVVFAAVVPRTELALAVQDVPAFGYETLYVRPAALPLSVRAPRPEALRVENEFLSVEADTSDGTLTLTDKRNGAVYPGLNRFMDEGDRGDEYNFCPVEAGQIVTAPVGPPAISVTRRGLVDATLEVRLTYALPAELDGTRRARSPESVPLSIITRATLTQGVPRLDLETIMDNTAADHRLRAAFPFPVRASRWRTETPWDVVERPVTPRDYESDPVYDSWQERPVAQQPQYRFCDVSAPGLGLMVANRGLPEVEARETDGGTTILLTLLRCVGWLSRDDLPVRRGHAGPGLPTPGAQCLGRHSFHYSLIPHQGDWQAAMPVALQFAAPMRAVPNSEHKGSLPSKGSFVDVRPAWISVSALKTAQDGQRMVLRLWNASGEPAMATVRLRLPVVAAESARLDETPIGPLPVSQDGTLAVPMRARQAVTVLLTPRE